MGSKVTRSSGRLRTTVWSLLTALVIGLVGAWISRPIVVRELAIARLFSSRADARLKARAWLLEPIDSDDGRRLPRIRVDGALADRIVIRLASNELMTFDERAAEVVQLFREAELWAGSVIPAAVRLRWIDWLIRDGSTAGANLAFTEFERLEDEDVDDSTIAGVWRSLISPSFDPSIRREAVIHCAAWYGEHEIPFELMESALQDPAKTVRRTAWIIIGLRTPLSGYRADWKSEPDRDVVEAILWASIRTNPDRPAPIIEALEAASSNERILPWILSRSDDDEARLALLELESHADSVALIASMESGLLSDEELQTQPAIAAWFGHAGSNEPVHRRWMAWRRNETLSIDEFESIIDWPVAADGSVWATVLLAERLLSPDDAHELASRWLRSMDFDSKRSAILLLGLIGRIDTVEVFESRAGFADLRRTVRLTKMMNHPTRSDSIELEFAFARRTYDAATPREKLDILLARLAAGDPTSVDALLTLGQDDGASASNHLALRAWLVERFLPFDYEVVAPINPWIERVARLQLDVLSIHSKIAGSAQHFDANQRAFEP